jgi:very-short-patch-repair endonuclease
MGHSTLQRALVRRQHGVVARWQLLERGFNADAINHRLERGRLHPVFRGVYAVGRPEVTQYGLWMAAVLASGPYAVLSHESAAALWGIRGYRGDVTVSIPAVVVREHSGIRVHRRVHIDATTHRGIPVTTPTATLIDLAANHPRNEVEAALNEADLRGLIKLEALRNELEITPRRPGLGKLKTIIDRRTFTFTRSELERRFLPIARRAGLTKPLTRVYVNGYEVDFYFPDIGLVVEADGGTFHRTPMQQSADRRRDHAHATAHGPPPLRFTHGQIRYEPAYVEQTLTRVALRPVPA